MLIELPNGDWINPSSVLAVRMATDTKYGPRVVIDTHQHYGHHMIEFDGPEAARAWVRQFAQKCNAAPSSERVS